MKAMKDEFRGVVVVGAERHARHRGPSRFTLALIAAVWLPLVAHGQNFSTVLEAIKNVERKLETTIADEATARKAADGRLMAAIKSADGGGSAGGDSARDAQMQKMAGAIAKAESVYETLTPRIDELAAKVNSMDSAESVARIRELAVDLKNLTGELRGVIGEADRKKAESAVVESAGEQKEAMELGGVVTLDAGVDPTEVREGEVTIGSVELTATVNIAEGVTAAIAIIAESDLAQMRIDQAVVQLAPPGKPFALLFGQQVLNHGLLSTRLISDPLLLDAVETSAPSVVLGLPFERVAPGLGIFYLHEAAVTVDSFLLDMSDSSVTRQETTISDATRDVGAVVNIDLPIGEETTARLSARYVGGVLDMALGAGLVLGGSTIDVEAFLTPGREEQAGPSGCYAGYAYSLREQVTAAFRYDYLSERLFSDPEHRLGLGVSAGIAHGIFAAIEYGLSLDSGGLREHELAMQFGLEQTIKLPGFQRQTLVRKQKDVEE